VRISDGGVHAVCRSRRPFVTMKASTDANGVVDGDPSKPAFRFSSDESLRLAHDVRANSMAILVGVGTVIRDNPSLTVRGLDIAPREQPTRVVIDPNGRIPAESKLLRDGEAPTLIIQSSKFDTNGDGGHVERVVVQEQEIPVSRILDLLGDRGIQSLLVEGGPETWSRFLSSGLVNRARVCVSPIELDGDGLVFDRGLLSEHMSLISESEVSGDSIEWWIRD